METGELCRICACSAKLLLPIFEGEGKRGKLSMKIRKHLPIQVDEDDCLPDRVCYPCSSTLNAWHKLVEKCVAADKKLRGLLATQEKPAVVAVEEEISIDNAPVSNDGDGKNTAEEQAGKKDEVEERVVGDIHRSIQCDDIRFELIDQSLNTILQGPVPKEMGRLRLFPPSNTLLVGEPHFSNYNSNEEVSHAVIIPKYQDAASTELRGHVFTDDGDSSLSKCGGDGNVLLVSDSKAPCAKQTQSDDATLQAFGSEMFSSQHVHRCKCCGETCSDDNQLEAHQLLHQRNILHCPVCDKTLSTFRTLKLHFSVHADTGLRLCNFCTSVFSDQSELEKHEASHQNDRPHLCETCGKGFKYRRNMLDHCSTHLDDSIVRKFMCEFCGGLYRNKMILKKHLTFHINEGKKDYICKICGKGFISKEYLTLHLSVHSDRKPYKCTKCKMAFKWKKNLNTHQRVHDRAAGKLCEKEGNRKTTRVQCDICGRYLASKWNLYLHKKRHCDVDGTNFTKSFLCHVCGKKLGSRHTMSQHLNTHSGLKPFKCSVCGKNLSTKQSRVDHERTHTGEKPFCCDVCGRCFGCKASLSVHRGIHFGKRPFECEYCLKRFSRRDHLVLHVRTHTGEKPYSCDTCSRAFIQKFVLTKHMLTHSNEQPFVCEYGTGFRQKKRS